MEGSLELGGLWPERYRSSRRPQRLHLGLLPRQAKPRRDAFHNLRQLFIHRAGGLRGLSLNFLALKHLLLFLGITQQSTSRWIRWCQRDRIKIIQQFALVLGRRTKRKSSRSTCEPHNLILLRGSTLQTEPSGKMKKVDDVFPRHPLYCGRTGSDVIGCRRPTSCVFVCLLQTRVVLTAFPIVTRRGHSLKFPWRGTH